MIFIDDDGVVPEHRQPKLRTGARVASLQDWVPPNVARMVLYSSPAWRVRTLNEIIPDSLFDSLGEPAMTYADLISIALGPGQFTSETFWRRLAHVRPFDAIIDKSEPVEQFRLLQESKYRKNFRLPFGATKNSNTNEFTEWYSGSKLLGIIGDPNSLQSFLDSKLKGEDAFLIKAAVRNEQAIFESLRGKSIEIAYRIFWRRVLEEEMVQFGSIVQLPFMWSEPEVYLICIGVKKTKLMKAIRAAAVRVKAKALREITPLCERFGPVRIADIPAWGYRPKGDTGFLYGQVETVNVTAGQLWKQIFPDGRRFRAPAKQVERASQIAAEEKFLQALHGEQVFPYLERFYASLRSDTNAFTDVSEKTDALIAKIAKYLDTKNDSFEVYCAALTLMALRIEDCLLRYGRASYPLCLLRLKEEDPELEIFAGMLPIFYEQIVKIVPIILSEFSAVVAPIDHDWT